MIKQLRLEAHLSPASNRQHSRCVTCRSLRGANTLRHLRVMSQAKHSESEAAVDEMRRSEGQGLASSQALADDAIIWASLHGLVRVGLMK